MSGLRKAAEEVLVYLADLNNQPTDLCHKLQEAMAKYDTRQPVAWMNVKEHSFPDATTKEYRQILIKTHCAHTLVAHCAWDFSGEYQPAFGPDWYCSTYKGDPKLLDIASVRKWMPLPKDQYYIHPYRELSDDEIDAIWSRTPDEYVGYADGSRHLRFARAIEAKIRGEK